MTARILLTEALPGLLVTHVWQSTLVVLAAAILCLVLRRYRAEVRGAILTAASVKFLIPFAFLAIAGTWLPWPAPPIDTSGDGIPGTELPTRLVSVFGPGPGSEATPPPDAGRSAGLLDAAPIVLPVVWAAGSIVLLARRLRSVAAAARIRRRARPLERGREAEAFARATAAWPHARVELRVSPDCDSPCVLGVWRPVLLWPDGIGAELTDAQLDAIVAHEIAHVRRRDNLAAAAHALVEILFWFHPIVWWMSAELASTRERACDEEVLAAGAARDDYADGILKVCERSLVAPAAGAIGITGSPLVRRIEAIMMTHTPRPLGSIRRALLVAVAAAVVAVPLAAGALNKPPIQAGRSRISGVVTDQMGGVMAGVTVTAQASTGVERQGVSDDAGRYVIEVPEGVYTVRFRHPGFKSHSAMNVPVRGGADVPVNVQLGIGSVSEAVTLTAQMAAPTTIDTASLLARETDLLQQLAQTPDDVEIHKELAFVYYRLERYADSEAAMQRAALLIAQRAAERRSDYVVTLPRGGEIKEPRKIRDVKPIYPAIAQAARVSGVVILEARIAEDGTVRDVRVLRGVPLLDAAAAGAVRQWLFTPTLLNGAPVEVVITATVNFTLRESGARR